MKPVPTIVNGITFNRADYVGIGRGVLLIILGILIGILITLSWADMLTANIISISACVTLLIFFGIAIICGGTTFGRAGIASVVLGILVILFGIVVLLNPDGFEHILFLFFGGAAIFSGLFNIVLGIINAGNTDCALTIIAGILGIILGFLFVVTNPSIPISVLVYAVAIYIFIYGVILILQVIKIKRKPKKAEA